MGNACTSIRSITLWWARDRRERHLPTLPPKTGALPSRLPQAAARTHRRRGRLYDSFFKAAGTLGLKPNRDYNGADQEGIAMTQASISKGRRMSTARCYLDPARLRSNLTIETDALAESLILEGTRCVGVRYS